MEVMEMAKEYLIKVVGCDDSTEVIIQADDIEFAAILNLARKVNEKSDDLCQPTMSIYKATQAVKRRLEDE